MSVQNAPLWPPWEGQPPLRPTRTRLLSMPPRRGRRRVPVLVSVLLHAGAIVLILFVMRQHGPSNNELTPPGVSMVFEPGGGPRAAVPNPSEAPPNPTAPEGPPRPEAPQAPSPPPPLPAPIAPPPPAPPVPVPPPVPAPPVPAPPAPALPAPTPPTPAPPIPAPPVPAPPVPAPPIPAPPPPVPLPAPSPVPTTPPTVNLEVPSATQAPAISLPPPVPVPQAPPIPVPPVPPTTSQPPRAMARPRPAPNPLSQYGILLNGNLNLAPPSRSQGDSRRGALSYAPNTADIDAKEASPGWLNNFSEWVQSHAYYPRAAAEAGQQGDVTVAIVVDRYGKVHSVQLERRSDSPFLNLALQGMFRGQTVPPFPGGEGPDEITVHVTMHYVLVGG